MERANEKYGWVVYIGLGLLWLVVGLYQIILPRELLVEDIQLVLNLPMSELELSSPEAMDFVIWVYGSLGLVKVSWSLFVLAITLTGFRKGEKWAWYTLWLVPILLITTGLFNTFYLGDVSQMLQWVPILSLSLLGIFLPYRKFFPKQS
ncbi:MAG: hypothetical protein ACFFF4_01235 [Candidatus Thorarchaeota archaeon]